MRSVSSFESNAVDRWVCEARRARVMFFAVRRRAEFEADGVDSQRVVGLCRWQGHGSMLALC